MDSKKAQLLLETTWNYWKTKLFLDPLTKVSPKSYMELFEDGAF
jgi:hypothetical protein